MGVIVGVGVEDDVIEGAGVWVEEEVGVWVELGVIVGV